MANKLKSRVGIGDHLVVNCVPTKENETLQDEVQRLRRENSILKAELSRVCDELEQAGKLIRDL